MLIKYIYLNNYTTRKYLIDLSTIHGAHWPTVRERLIKELRGENQDNVVKLAEIFAAENLDADLLQLLEENPRLVNQYGMKLHRVFPQKDTGSLSIISGRFSDPLCRS